MRMHVVVFVHTTSGEHDGWVRVVGAWTKLGDARWVLEKVVRYYQPISGEWHKNSFQPRLDFRGEKGFGKLVVEVHEYELPEDFEGGRNFLVRLAVERGLKIRIKGVMPLPVDEGDVMGSSLGMLGGEDKVFYLPCELRETTRSMGDEEQAF